VRELMRLAQQLAPGRIFFRRPVPALDIVRAVADYDLGLCVIQPRTFNTLMMLPNKLFEYIQAGLPVCIGPSPAMIDLVRSRHVGVVTPGFSSEDIARTLDGLTNENLAAMRSAAQRAARTLNADVEMGKIVDLYDLLLGRPTLAAV
jgi:hypothetical protein